MRFGFPLSEAFWESLPGRLLRTLGFGVQIYLILFAAVWSYPYVAKAALFVTEQANRLFGG